MKNSVAEEKGCPFMISDDGDMYACMTTECMAWAERRARTASGERSFEPEGYCGLMDV